MTDIQKRLSDARIKEIQAFPIAGYDQVADIAVPYVSIGKHDLDALCEIALSTRQGMTEEEAREILARAYESHTSDIRYIDRARRGIGSVPVKAAIAAILSATSRPSSGGSAGRDAVIEECALAAWSIRLAIP